MKYTPPFPVGLGKLERSRLSTILCATHSTISISEAADVLNMPRQKAARLLALYAKKGWLIRIHAGVYIPVPLDSKTTDIMLEDPFIIAEKLFAPCYIAGWSAAEYWGMTEQIFHSIVVMTGHQQKNYRPKIRETDYLLHFARPQTFFGLEVVWRNNVKVHLSDRTRTLVDLVNNPQLGGGIRSVLDILHYYFSSKHKSIDLLINYLHQLGNGAAYKRLGFLIEKYYPEEKDLINECRSKLTTGNARLDFSLECRCLVTRWRLWVPKNWK